MARLSSLMRHSAWNVQLGLAAGVDEDERGLGGFDRVHHIGHGVARQMPRPRHMRFRRDDRDLRLGAGLRPAPAPRAPRRPSVAAPESAAAAPDRAPWRKARRGDGRAPAWRAAPGPAPEDRRAWCWRRRAARPPPRPSDRSNTRGASCGRQQQRQLLGRGEQDIRRRIFLALAARRRGVAGAGFDAHGQTHLGHRRFQIARHVHRQRLQRRDVERVERARLFRRGCAGRGRPSSIRLGRKPASVLPPPVGATSSTDSPGQPMRHQAQLMRPRRPAARGEPGRGIAAAVRFPRRRAGSA